MRAFERFTGGIRNARMTKSRTGIGCAALAAHLLFCALAFSQTRPALRGKSQYETFAMTKPGDAARGKALFFDDSKLACSKCHTVDSKGGKAGPDLFAIADKFGRRDLVESILSP